MKKEEYYINLHPKQLLNLKRERLEEIYLGLPCEVGDNILLLQAQAQKEDFQLLENLTAYFEGNNPKFKASNFSSGFDGFRVPDRTEEGGLIDLALRAKVAEIERPSATVCQVEAKSFFEISKNFYR